MAAVRDSVTLYIRFQVRHVLIANYQRKVFTVHSVDSVKAQVNKKIATAAVLPSSFLLFTFGVNECRNSYRFRKSSTITSFSWSRSRARTRVPLLRPPYFKFYLFFSALSANIWLAVEVVVVVVVGDEERKRWYINWSRNKDGRGGGREVAYPYDSLLHLPVSYGSEPVGTSDVNRLLLATHRDPLFSWNCLY